MTKDNLQIGTRVVAIRKGGKPFEGHIISKREGHYTVMDIHDTLISREFPISRIISWTPEYPEDTNISDIIEALSFSIKTTMNENYLLYLESTGKDE